MSGQAALYEHVVRRAGAAGLIRRAFFSESRGARMAHRHDGHAGEQPRLVVQAALSLRAGAHTAPRPPCRNSWRPAAPMPGYLTHAAGRCHCRLPRPGHPLAARPPAVCRPRRRGRGAGHLQRRLAAVRAALAFGCATRGPHGGAATGGRLHGAGDRLRPGAGQPGLPSARHRHHRQRPPSADRSLPAHQPGPERTGTAALPPWRLGQRPPARRAGRRVSAGTTT